jgi:hypothetical protein
VRATLTLAARPKAGDLQAWLGQRLTGRTGVPGINVRLRAARKFAEVETTWTIATAATGAGKRVGELIVKGPE